MDVVKKIAVNLCNDIRKSLEINGQPVNTLRVKVILFENYRTDREPMIFSPFLTLPDKQELFDDFVKSIETTGGGNVLNSGLEALAYAMKSDWCGGYRKRHIIALFTNAPAHELGHGMEEAIYPLAGMPKDFGELTEMWGDDVLSGEMDRRAKRLLLFAPDIASWHTIANCWENTVIVELKNATGMNDFLPSCFECG